MESYPNLVDIRSYDYSRHFFAGAGREDLLHDLLRLVRIESPSLCVLSGPDGIGKTMLLKQLRRLLFTEMHTICLEGHFGTTKSVLERLSSHIALDWNSEWSDKEALNKVADQLCRTADGRPILVLFDDAHALPLPVIRNLVRFLDNRALDVRTVLFVDNEAVDVICHFLRRQQLRNLSIRRLTRDEVPAYLQHRYRRETKFDQLELDTIFDASEGVPARINRHAEYTLKQRAITAAAAPKTKALNGHGTAIASLQSRQGMAYGLAACLTLGIALVSLSEALQWNSLKPASEAIVETDLLPELEEEQFADLGDDYELELPEEFVEFSNQLSDDEVALLQTEPDQYVLQFLAGDSEEDMAAFVEEYDEFGVKMYRSLLDGEPWYKAVATTGISNRDEAEAIIDLLPNELKQEQPWVRTVASVQQEILTMGEQHLAEPEDADTASLESWIAQLSTQLRLTQFI